MNRFKFILLSFLAPFIFASTIGATQSAHAFNLFPKDTVCSGEAAKSPTCKQAKNPDNPVTGPKNVIKTAATIIALITGIAAVIMIILSGLTMITSGGNADSVATARRRLIAAIIGLIIVVLAWTIVTFTVNHLT
jgi:hypothetical protein